MELEENPRLETRNQNYLESLSTQFNAKREKFAMKLRKDNRKEFYATRRRPLHSQPEPCAFLSLYPHVSAYSIQSKLAAISGVISNEPSIEIRTSALEYLAALLKHPCTEYFEVCLDQSIIQKLFPLLDKAYDDAIGNSTALALTHLSYNEQCSQVLADSFLWEILKRLQEEDRHFIADSLL